MNFSAASKHLSRPKASENSAKRVRLNPQSNPETVPGLSQEQTLFYEHAQRAIEETPDGLITDTYVMDERPCGRLLVERPACSFFVYHTVMRCMVSGDYRCYLNERLFNGVLIRQREYQEVEIKEMFQAPVDSEQTRNARESDFQLFTIPELEEHNPKLDDSVDQDRTIHSSSPLENLFDALEDGMRLEGDPNLPEPLIPWWTRFSSFVFGEKRITLSGNEELQRSIDADYDYLASRDMTLLEGWRWCVKNWRSVHSAPLGKHTLNLIGVAIAAGLLPEDYSSFHLQTIEIFRIKMEDFTAMDRLIDATIEALNYFVESALASWDKGDLSPFMYEKTMSATLDEAYECVSRIMTLVANGQDSDKWDWASIFKKVDAAETLYENAMRLAPGGSLHRKLLFKRFEQLGAWKNELMNARASGKLVKQAPCFVYFGAPGCGKSMMSEIMFKFHSALFDLDFDPAMIADIITGEAFDSKITNRTRYIRQDDVGNRPLQYDPSYGIAKMLQICNNVQFSAIKAELELKGKVNPQIQLAVGTTNKKEMDMHLLSCDPNSLRRRIYRVDVVVYPQFANDIGGVDSFKIGSAPEMNIAGNVMRCIQHFTINVPGREGYQPMEFEGKRCSKLSLHEFLTVLEALLVYHDNVQTDFLEQTNKIEFSKCPKCKKIICDCLPPVPVFPDSDLTKRKWEEAMEVQSLPGLIPAKDLDDESIYDGKPYDQVHLESPELTEEQKVKWGWRNHSTAHNYRVTKGKIISSWNETREEAFFWSSSRPSDPWGYRNWWRPFWKRFTPNFIDIFWSQMGAVKDLWESPAWVKRTVADQTARLCAELLRDEERLTWWFWIPEDWWKTEWARAASTAFPPRELHRQITIARRCFMASGFFLCTSFLGVGTCLTVGPERSYTARMAESCVVHLARASPLLFGGLMKAVCPRPTQHLTRNDALVCSLGLAVPLYMYSWYKHRICYPNAYAYLTKRRRAISEASALVREKYSDYIKGLLGAVLTATAGYALYCGVHMYFNDSPDRQARKKLGDRPEGVETSFDRLPSSFAKDREEEVRDESLFSEKKEDLIARDAKLNVWEQLCVANKMNYRNPNMTTEQLRKLVVRNLVAIFRVVDGKDEFLCNGLYSCSDFLWMPAHVMPKKEEYWRLVDTLANTKETAKLVTPQQCYEIPKVDGGCMHIPGRDKKNLMPYFNGFPDHLFGDFLWKDPDTLALADEMVGLLGTHIHLKRYDRKAIGFEWPKPTRVGLCGGVYLASKAKHPAIIGIHNAGLEPDFKVGLSFCPSQEDIMEAARTFHRRGMLLLARCPEKMSRILNGQPTFIESTTLPKMSVLEGAQWLEDNEQPPTTESRTTPPVPPPNKDTGGKPGIKVSDAKVKHQGATYVGSRPNSAFYKSRAVESMIADSVKEIYIGADYGKPKFGRGMWAKSARYSFDTSPGFPPDHMKWAQEDYVSAFADLPAYIRTHLRPLTKEETLNGIPGIKAIDAMNWATSMGINFGGGKKAWVIPYLCAITGQELKDFKEDVWLAVEEAEKALKTGERVYWLFNATPKDEPTDVTKEKVRLFMVAEIALTVLVRKYFTPVGRVIQMLTGRSECAVGIDCLSEDWEELWTHMERFANWFDGDHPKFDLRVAPTTGSAAYWVCIIIASYGSYTAEELFLMTIIATELISPLVNYNGEVYLQDGGTPSGIPITVIINSIINSLMARCAYKSVYPAAKVGTFRRYVSLITYGDDFIASVSFYARRFNFLSMKAYYDFYGTGLTPGVKDATPRAFIKDRREITFLKRTCYHPPQLKHRVGILAEASIFKSLLCVLEGSLSPAEAAATNIDNAIREFAYYPPQVYMRRSFELEKVARDNGIGHLCQLLHVPQVKILASMGRNVRHSEVIPPVGA